MDSTPLRGKGFNQLKLHETAFADPSTPPSLRQRAGSREQQRDVGGRFTRELLRPSKSHSELPPLATMRPGGLGARFTGKEILGSSGEFGGQIRLEKPLPPPKQDGLRIVFLDVDGVLHSVRALRPEQQFRPACMQLLQKILKIGNAAIVFSTAWRLSPQTMSIVNAKLRQYGMDTAIDKTCDFGPTGRRSDEVLKWVDAWQPSAWVAIDDMNLGGHEPRMSGHFVHTNALVGLTPELANKAIEYLNGPSKDNSF